MERKTFIDPKQHALDTALRLGSQYLNPNYDLKRDIEAQMDNERNVFDAVMATLTKENQDVNTVWRIIKKTRK